MRKINKIKEDFERKKQRMSGKATYAFRNSSQIHHPLVSHSYNLMVTETEEEE